jgi:hypothetical protein
MFSRPPGSEEICKIWFWQDDASSLRFATVAEGPNRVSLIEAQKNYMSFGAAEQHLKQQVRLPRPVDKRGPTWRPIDPDIDVLDRSQENPGPKSWPDDMTELYYWSDDYWLKGKRGQRVHH